MSLDPRPDPDCRVCRGTGTVYDWVPYGATEVQLPNPCDCVHTPRAIVTLYLDSPIVVTREPDETDVDVFLKAVDMLRDMLRPTESPEGLKWRIEDEEDLEGEPGSTYGTSPGYSEACGYYD